MVFSFPNPLPTARAFICHRHDGTQQTLVHPTKPYSPNCLEEGSSRKPAFSRTNPYTLGPGHHLISERATWSFDENGDTTLTELSGQRVQNGKFEFNRTIDVV